MFVVSGFRRGQKRDRGTFKWSPTPVDDCSWAKVHGSSRLGPYKKRPGNFRILPGFHVIAVVAPSCSMDHASLLTTVSVSHIQSVWRSLSSLTSQCGRNCPRSTLGEALTLRGFRLPVFTSRPSTAA
jgi:hypothetical protein